MTVQQIHVQALDVPMRAVYQSARRTTTTAHNVLVTLTLRDMEGTETIGYGESSPATYVTGETQESVLQAVREMIPNLLGQSLERARQRILEQCINTPGALGALEIALLDAQARAVNLPLYRLLGGGTDTKTDAVTDISLPILPPDEAGVRAQKAATDGFRSIKIKVGGSDTEMDLARVHAIAVHAPAARIRLDGNQGFTAENAVRFLDALGDLLARIELFEQPTNATDDAALRFVAERVPCPVFADEAVHTPADATRLLETGACKGVVLKVAKSGIAGAKAIAEAAHIAGSTCMFGCMMETRIGIGASLHLALALGNGVVPFLDLDGHLLVNDTGLLTGGFTQNRDTLIVDRYLPGLGVLLV